MRLLLCFAFLLSAVPVFAAAPPRGREAVSHWSLRPVVRPRVPAFTDMVQRGCPSP